MLTYLPDANAQNPGGSAFGVTTMQQVAELNKALSIDYSHPPTNFSASPLRQYSIDATLRSVSYSQKHIKLWNRMTKTAANSTVEEYNKLLSYGSATTGAFINSGALPESHDTQYVRENKNVKYLGTLRSVEHVATLVKTVTVDDLIAQETVNGTVYLLGIIEEHLFTGNSTIIPQEWDGLYAEIETAYAADATTDIVIDLRGASIAKADLTDAANVTLKNYGIPSAFYSDLLVMADLNTLFYGNQRYNDQRGGAAITGGAAQGDFVFMPGQTFDFIPNVFLRPGKTAPTVGAVKAPGIPTVAPVAAPGAGSKFTVAITGRYVVTSINSYGESAGSAAANVAIAAGDNVTLTITIAAPTAYAATGFNIYRIDAATGTPVFMKKITNTGLPRVYVDKNEDLPGTSNATLLMEDPTNLVFKQLAPFTKIPLATIDTSIRWMQVLYGVPILATPTKNVLFKNIGRRAGSLV